MPDINIDPASLSRAEVNLGTPTLTAKSISVNASGAQKPKTSQIVPARIDLEPFYAAVKAVIPSDKWKLYKETVSNLAYGMVPLAIFMLLGVASAADISDRPSEPSRVLRNN